MSHETVVNTDGLRAASDTLTQVAAGLRYEPPSQPQDAYASSVGAGCVSVAIGMFTSAYAARIADHASNLNQAARRYDETDSDGAAAIGSTQ